MADSETEAQYKQAFIERVKASRISTGMKQWQVAEILGMDQSKYKQYEGRSLLPHYLIGRFCLITRVDPNWLLTGKGAKPLPPLQTVETEPAAIPKPVRAKRRQHRLHRL
jgi:hypothetical protein